MLIKNTDINPYIQYELNLGLLVVYHGYCGKWLLDFKHDKNERSHVYYRWMNEVPVLFLFAIVILAVVKPF